ncbi:MAG: XisH family protein [Pseudomonadota bacterium]
MPAKDIFHDAVKNALQKDGWTITHDPFFLKVGRRKLYGDLGAERLMSAGKGAKEIAIEIKSFVGKSLVKDLEQAVGQFFVYYKVLQLREPNRHLYLAVNEITFNGILSEEIGKIVLSDPIFRLIIFDEEKEVITQWVPD